MLVKIRAITMITRKIMMTISIKQTKGFNQKATIIIIVAKKNSDQAD